MTRNEALELYVQTYRAKFGTEPNLYWTDHWTTLDFQDEIDWMELGYYQDEQDVLKRFNIGAI